MTIRWTPMVFLLIAATAQTQESGRGIRTLMPLHDVTRAFQAAEEGNDLPIKCGLPVVTAAIHHRQELGTEQVQALAKVLARPFMQTSIERGGFRVHFDTTGTDAPALLDGAGRRIEGTARRFADSVAASLVYSASVEIGILGYNPPPEDGDLGGGPEYDVYIAELGLMYGYTTPDSATAEGGRSPSSIMIDNDFSFVSPNKNKGLPAMRVTIAHEFHHAIQMGAYGYWTNDAYFYEMTSTWMEDVVYPDVDDYLNYLSSSWPYSHFVVPDKPFDTDDLTMYSRGIWCHYIAKRFGTIAMRRCWEHIRVLRPLRAIDVALQDLGTGFSAAYGEWMLWNFFTGPRADTSAYYHEGNLYPSVAMVPANFDPPQETRTLTNSLTNLGGRYHDVRRLLDTLVLAVSYVDMAAWSEGSSPTQSYTYSLTTRGGGSGYTSLGNGISIKLDAPVIASWHSLAFLNGKLAGEAGLPEMRSGLAFPSPFISDGFNFVNITVPTSTRTAGTLMLFSSSMDLVRSEKISTALVGRQQCAQWDGKHSSGSLAPTGIYFYHLEYTDPASGSQRRMDGKLVLIRK